MGKVMISRRGGGKSTTTLSIYSTYITDLSFGSAASDNTSNLWTMPSNTGCKHLAVYQRPYSGNTTDSNLLYTLDLTQNTTIVLHNYSYTTTTNGYFASLTLEVSGGIASLRYRTTHVIYDSENPGGLDTGFDYGVILFGY
jgi:hypothetical protein